MAGQLGAQIAGIDDDVDHADREYLPREAAHHQAGRRSRRCGFQHEGVSREHRHGELCRAPQQRKVPGRNAGHDAKRPVVGHNPRLLVVPQHLLGKLDAAVPADEERGGLDLAPGFGDRLPLLQDQHPGKSLSIRVQGVSQPPDTRTALRG